MNVANAPDRETARKVDHFDVLIVGAGISGIDAAYHLQQRHPGMSFRLLDRMDTIGGTWAWHKYPGIRSDSDLYTFGFSWKPWMGVPIATAEEIMAYLREAVAEQDIERHIDFGQEVRDASWDSSAKLWTVEVEDLATGALRVLSAGFLWMCQGYYRHQTPHTPDWPGMDRFQGEIVHPQLWPEELDYTGKTVVVIGSGATAATLVPAMAPKAAQITMLQRSPTYFFARPNVNELAEMLEPLGLPDETFHDIMRRKYLHDGKVVAKRSREDPEGLRKDLLAGAKSYLGQDYPIDPHFTPSYRPWRQRLALIPDGDLYKAIGSGQASVVTDEIETFTETGLSLKSGTVLEADIIITATGFNLSALGDIPFRIDGETLDFANCWAHRGIMFSGVPNLAWMFGYLRTSWTMRADLIADFVCRLLDRMQAEGADMVMPTLRPEDEGMEPRPFIEAENFNAGYIMRNIHIMP
ncbi:MAG: NAD(P)/FAD-dependent oxidoreductase, partial [Pseudomonadota bacterium]